MKPEDIEKQHEADQNSKTAIFREINTNLRRLIELTEMLVFGPAKIEQELTMREQEKELAEQRDAERMRREDGEI